MWTPKPPYPLKVLWYSTPQTYKTFVLFPLLDLAAAKSVRRFRPVLPWAAGKMVLALSHCFFNYFFSIFFVNSLIHKSINLSGARLLKIQMYFDLGAVYNLGMLLLPSTILLLSSETYI